MDTLRSLQFGIIVLVAIIAVSMVGTIIPQGQYHEFYRERYNPLVTSLVEIFRLDDTYSSPLFLGLMGLFGLNLILCTLHRFPAALKSSFRPDLSPDRQKLARMPIRFTMKGATIDTVERAFKTSGFRLKRVGDSRLFGDKGRLGRLGATIVHLSLLFLLAGGMVSLLTGKRGRIVLNPGETTSLMTLPNGSKIPLGFAVRLDHFSAEFYEDYPNRPKSYTSSVTVTPNNGDAPFTRDVRVNHPLILNGFTVFQSSYGLQEPEFSSAPDDTAHVEIRFKDTPENMPAITALDMVQGGVYPVPGFGDSVQVRLAELHRNFRMGGPSSEFNPAALIDVIIQDETRWSVYAFRNFPGLNMPMHQELDFQFFMTDLRTTGTGPEEADVPSYYTVLGVVRDRGIPLVWFGSFLMMAGFFLSFYIRPRRLWALEENGTVLIGAQTKGESDSFREFIGNALEINKHLD